MPDISLTTFLDFAHQAGTPKVTCVRNAKKMYGQDYDPAFDFWRPVREQIISVHRQGLPKRELDQVLRGLTDGRKRSLYPNIVRQYKSWMGRRSFQWIGRNRTRWDFQQLEVRVNPEIGVSINDVPYLIKLYFKREKLAKRRVQTVLHLLGQLTDDNTHVAVLDIPNRRLHEQSEVDPGEMQALLEAEAMSFLSLWNAIEVG